MSFSSKVKNELVKIEYDENCCKKSLLYGMALFAKSFSAREVLFQNENENIILLYKKLLKELCNIDTRINISKTGKSFSSTLSKEESTKLFGFFGHNPHEASVKVNIANFSCQRCQNAFLAGAFLACGTITSPEKNYHLEFTIGYQNLAKSLVTLLQEMELAPKITKRSGYYNIVYFKDSEAIEDCLYLMGAASSMFDMMNIKIVKEIRNSANRKANCETANIDKMVRAASPQIAAIMKIEDKKGLDSLPAALKQMAEVRLENPDSSLQELCEMFDPPLSKSGVNHRLKRIVEIANQL